MKHTLFRPNSHRLLVPIACFFLAVSCDAEKDDSDNTHVESVTATTHMTPAEACQRDPELLEIIRSPAYACGDCTDLVSGLVDEVCVLTECNTSLGQTDLHCGPELDYRCVGELRIASDSCSTVVVGPASRDCCPARFRYTDDGYCEGANPQRCHADGDCPDGTYCSAERGGICWFDCVPVAPATGAPSVHGAEVCATCDCSGRCQPPDYRSVPSVRPAIATSPESIAFPVDAVAASHPAEERGFQLSAKLVGAETLKILVKAPYGFAVACMGASHAAIPASADFHQECESDHNDQVTTRIWVRPTQAVQRGLEQGDAITLWWVGSDLGPVASIPLVVTGNPPDDLDLPTGWYRGRLRVGSSRLITSSASTTAFTSLDAGASSLEANGFDAIAYYEAEKTPGVDRLEIIEEMGLLFPDGFVSIDLEDGERPNLSPLIFLGSRRNDQATRSVAASTMIMSAISGSVQAGEVFFEKREGRSFSVSFGTAGDAATGNFGDLAEAAALKFEGEFRFDRMLQEARPGPGDSEGISGPVNTEARSDWLELLGLTTSPASLGSAFLDTRYYGSESYHSISNCLWKGTTVGNLWLTTCEAAGRDDCPAVLAQMAATEVETLGKAARFCVNRGATCTDRVRCYDVEGYLIPDSDPEQYVNACANDPIRVIEGGVESPMTSYASRYYSAASCAMRVGSYDFSWDSSPRFESRFELFDPRRVDSRTGDLLIAPISSESGPPGPESVPATGIWSGAPRLPGTSLPNLTFPLALTSDGLSARDSAIRCLSDLNRKAPEFEYDLGPGGGKATDIGGEDVRVRLQDLFENSGCVDTPRLHLETALLVEAADIELDGSLTDAAIHKDFTATRLFQRRLKQWLDIHGFVAKHVAESHRSDQALDYEGTEESLPYTLQEVLATMESGWSFLLYPDHLGLLSRLTRPADNHADLIAFPDYRKAHVTSNPSILGASDGPGQHDVAVPVVILETLASHMRLAEAYLDDEADDLYFECKGGGDRPKRDRVMSIVGEAYRWNLVMQGVANSMTFAVWQHYGGAAGPSGAGVPTGSTWEQFVPWWADWNRARHDLSIALDSFTGKVNEIKACTHPLGLGDSSLPLYFIDPQGTNAKFFASSDYLLQGFAGPAVAEASAAFEAARTAMIQARESEIRQVQTDQDRERRVEQLFSLYGRPLAEACGLKGTPEEVLSGFLDGEYALANCHRVPPAERPECEGFVNRVWADTEASSSERPSYCNALPTDHGLGVMELRKDWCRIMYEYSEYVFETTVNGRNVRPVAEDDKNAFARLAVAETVPDARPALSAWLGSRFADYRVSLEDWLAHPSSERAENLAVFNRSAPPFGPWELFDEMSLNECGDEIRLGPVGAPIGRTIVDRGCELAYAGQKGYVRGTEGWACPANTDCVSCDGVKWRGEQWCAELLATRTYPNDFVDPQLLLETFPEASELAQCYRGKLAGAEIAVLQARQTVRASIVAVETLEKRYDLQARTCIQLSSVQERREAAMEEHRKALKEISETRGLLGIVADGLKFVGGVATAIAGFATGNPVAGVGGISVAADAAGGLTDSALGLDKKVERLNHRFAMTMASLEGEAAAINCWSEAQDIMANMTSQVEGVKLAMLGLSSAIVSGVQEHRSAANTLDEARVIIQREENRLSPEIRHHFWYDERAKKFETTMDWARKVLYLAMLALEYEVQASLGMGAMILGATHPNELEDALRELRRAQASRGINGNRPEEKTVVYSLRDELLQLSDKLAPDRPSAEKQVSRREEMIDILKSPQSAVFDSKGNYLGQALRFHVKPKGPLEYRCAERLWGISATVEGDLFGVLEPRLPVFILKQNTFRSQWCEGQSPDGSDYQIGMMRPSLDLFRPGTQQGQAGEIEAWSWAYVDAWLNVPRRNFASETYSEGDSEELAGRGLYGEYMLILPAWGFLDSEVVLEQIEDLLIRFEYVSVNDGGSFGPSPNDPEAAFPRTEIEGFQVVAGHCQIDISWLPPNTPGFDGVRVYRDKSDPVSNPVGPDEEIDCNEFSKACSISNLDWANRDSHYYGAFAFDDWGDITSSASIGPVPSPSTNTLVPSGFSGIDGGASVVALDWTRGSVETCTKTAIYRSATTPVAEVEGNRVYFGPLAEYADITVPGSSVGELRKWHYLARTCVADLEHCSDLKVELSGVLTHYFSDFVSSGSWQGWNTTGVDIVTLAGEEGAGVSGSSLSGCMRRNFTSGGTAAALSEEIRFEYILDRVSGATNPSLCVDISIQNSGSVQCTMTSHWTQLACMPVTSAWASVDVAIPAGSRALSRQLRFRMARSDVSDLVGVRKLNVWAQ